MDEKKRFQKQRLNSEDYKGIENGAKAIKGVVGAVVAFVTVYVNRDNLKSIVLNAKDILSNLSKRS